MSGLRSDEETRRWRSRARSAIVLGAVVTGAGALVLFGRAEHAVESAALRSTPAPAAAVTGGVVADAPRATATATATAALPARARAEGTSVVSRLMARYQPEDLELLSAVSRRTSAPPPPAVHRLLDAARRGADDAELTRMIREDVPGALVRHDCFDWLRKRRGEPRPKPPAFASRR